MKPLFHTALLAIAAATTAAQAAVLRVPVQYGSIQGAINAAHPGDVVEVEEGTYRERLTIINKSKITLRAAPGANVTVDADGLGYPLLIGYSGASTSDIVVKRLTIRNTSNGNGIWIGHADRVRIDRCEITEVRYDGISAIYSSSVVVKKCSISSTGGRGILSHQGSLHAIENSISSTGSHGIVLVGGLNAAYNNRITATGGDGIRLGDGTTTTASCLVQDNKITLAQDDGIGCLAGVTTTSLLNNRIGRCGDDGIDLLGGASWMLVTGNRIGRCDDSGIQVEGRFHSFKNNRIKRAGVDGIWIGPTGDNGVYQKNRISRSYTDGLDVWGVDILFRKNSATRSAAFDLRDHMPTGANSYVGNDFGTIAP